MRDDFRSRSSTHSLTSRLAAYRGLSKQTIEQYVSATISLLHEQIAYRRNVDANHPRKHPAVIALLQRVKIEEAARMKDNLVDRGIGE